MNTEKVAIAIAERMKAREQSNKPLEMYMDEAHRVIMQNRDDEYLTRLQMKQLRVKRNG